MQTDRPGGAQPPTPASSPLERGTPRVASTQEPADVSATTGRQVAPSVVVESELDALLSLLAGVRRRIVAEQAARREKLKVVK